MIDTTQKLTALEHDLLTELFNIGVGRAALALSQMLKQEIKLSVPNIYFLTRAELMQQYDNKTNVISITQNISGPFHMQSMLIFPSEGSIDVIRSMLGEHLTEDMAAELQQEAFTEIGNIVLNACIGIIAKTLDETFSIDLPLFNKDTTENIFIAHLSAKNQIIMSMQVDLILTSSAVTGYIAFILGSVSLENIRKSLNKMLNNV